MQHLNIEVNISIKKTAAITVILKDSIVLINIVIDIF